MVSAPEIEPVGPGLWLWRAYDPKVKVELFSTAIATASGIYLVDPIPLAGDALATLEKTGTIAGIVITNENHQRAADHFAEQFAAPIYRGNFATDGIAAVPIEGAVADEIAVYHEADDGTLIMGDALINCDPYGFALLPAKYCSNSKLMRRSLSRLLDPTFKRMLFAHGMPILNGARQRLEHLLKSQ